MAYNNTTPCHTGSFSNVGRQSQTFAAKPSVNDPTIGTINVAIAGIFSGAIISLTYSPDDGTTWLDTGTTYTANGFYNIPSVSVKYIYRLKLTAITQGTVTYSIWIYNPLDFSANPTTIDDLARAMSSPAGIAASGGALYSDIRTQLYPSSARNGIMTTKSANNTSQSIRRRRLNGLTPLTNIRVRVAWRYLDSNVAEQTVGNDGKVACSIEYPVGTQPRPLIALDYTTFQYQRDCVIRDGAIMDWVDPTGLVIPAGANYYVHLYVRGWVAGAPGGFIPQGRFTVNNGGLGYADKVVSDAVGTATDKTQIIGGETTAVATPLSMFDNFAVLGTPATGRSRGSVLIIGDSISYGFNENNYYGADSYGNTGPWERWVANANGAIGVNAQFGAINLAVSGNKANQWVNIATGLPYVNACFANLCSHAIVALGRNDIPADSTATVITNLTTIGNYLRTLGIKAYVSTITPKSTSTNSWADDANQTPDASDAKRQEINGIIRNNLLPYYGVFDLASVFESKTKAGCWISNGVANTYTSDGLHPSSAANNLIWSAFGSPDKYFAVGQ